MTNARKWFDVACFVEPQTEAHAQARAGFANELATYINKGGAEGNSTW
jgi:hypothetical protein